MKQASSAFSSSSEQYSNAGLGIGAKDHREKTVEATQNEIDQTKQEILTNLCRSEKTQVEEGAERGVMVSYYYAIHERGQRQREHPTIFRGFFLGVESSDGQAR